MKFGKLGILLTLAISTNAYCEISMPPLNDTKDGTWVILDKTADQSDESFYIYSEVTGKDNSNGIINFWTKAVFHTESPVAVKDDSLMSSMLINCKSKEYAHEASIIYNPKGEVINKFNYIKNNKLKWSKIPKQSNSQEIFRRHCPNAF